MTRPAQPAKSKDVLAWDAKKFDVLVPTMNDQHQVLIGLMNKLYVRHGARANKFELTKLLTDLRDYTVRHFREEEAMLASIDYPQLEMHKLIHEKLLSDFAKHFDAFTAGPGILAPAFFEFLRLWLTAHIMHIDRKYGQYAQQRSAA